MRGCVLALAVLLALAGTAARAAEPEELVRARALYNQADYDGAIEAATVARAEPLWSDAATLVLARAHLERYRLVADTSDLAAARDALGDISAATLGERDRVDLLIGMGQFLFFRDIFGAGAELFENALDRSWVLGARDRLLLLDWWATAIDREAQSRPPGRRGPLFERVMARMEAEIRDDPANATANYWLAVAARGVGDVDRAWHAAVAAWVRSSLAPENAERLRADVDRLVTEALVPERARLSPARDRPDPIGELRAEWESIKEQWRW